jgi:hypothetical protein
LILAGSVALAMKVLSSIAWKEQHGLMMQLKGMEKLGPMEVIQTRSWLMKIMSFRFQTTYLWIVQHPFYVQV